MLTSLTVLFRFRILILIICLLIGHPAFAEPTRPTLQMVVEKEGQENIGDPLLVAEIEPARTVESAQDIRVTQEHSRKSGYTLALLRGTLNGISVSWELVGAKQIPLELVLPYSLTIALMSGSIQYYTEPFHKWLDQALAQRYRGAQTQNCQREPPLWFLT